MNPAINPDPSTVLIHDERTHFTLEPLHRQYPDNWNYWDGNWIVTRFQATAPGFQADITETVHLREMVELRGELAILSAAPEGRVEWKAMDGFLDLVAVRDKLGHIHWTIALRRYSWQKSTTLTLEIENDQTYLPALLQQMDAVLKAFPLRGKP